MQVSYSTLYSPGWGQGSLYVCVIHSIFFPGLSGSLCYPKRFHTLLLSVVPNHFLKPLKGDSISPVIFIIGLVSLGTTQQTV